MSAALPAHHSKSVADAVRAHVGTLEVVLRASGISANAVRALPSVEMQRLQGEFDAAIEQSAARLTAQGLTCTDVENLARSARRADSGAAFLKAVTTNAASSMLVNLAVLAVTIPLSFVLSPIPLIVVSLSLSLALAWRFGMHAWAAGGTMAKLLDKSCNSRGFERRRFGKAAAPDAVRGAISQEATAEGVRTITRVVADFPRQLCTLLSGVLNIGAGWLPIFSAALAPVAALAGPLSNGLMEVVSVGISKRDNRYTLAPLFGICANAGKAITFDADALDDNRLRLRDPEARRAVSTIRRMAGIYCKHFSAEVKRERASGSNRAKLKELVLGGLATTPVMMGAAGSVASMAGSMAPLVKLAAGTTVPVLAGSLHVAKRPVVADALKNAMTRSTYADTVSATIAKPSATASTAQITSIRPRLSRPCTTANERHR